MPPALHKRKARSQGRFLLRPLFKLDKIGNCLPPPLWTSSRKGNGPGVRLALLRSGDFC